MENTENLSLIICPSNLRAKAIPHFHHH